MRAVTLLFMFLSLPWHAVESAERTATIKVAATRSQIVDGLHTIEVVDLSPQFLDFYQAALGADPATRWQLWGEKYGFADQRTCLRPCAAQQRIGLRNVSRRLTRNLSRTLTGTQIQAPGGS